MNRDGFLHYLSSAHPDRKSKGAPSIIRDVVLAAFDSVGSGQLRSVLAEAPVQGKVLPAGVGTNRERAMRVERLDGHQMVLSLLLCHVDIVTGDICRDADKTFVGMKVETIALKLGMDQRRVERILSDLHSVGIIQSWKRAERKGEAFIGRTSVRKLAMTSITTLIGLAKRWLDATREYYEKRRSIPKTNIQLAREDLQRRARENAQPRSVNELLSKAPARAGAPPGPSLGPPLKAR